MKQLALLVLLCVLSTISINAQTLPECESIVQDFVHAINMHSPDGFDDSYYASEFKYNEFEGDVAIMVVGLTFQNLEDNVVSFERMSESKDGSYLTLTYIFNLSIQGNKEAIFTFDKDNKLTFLQLFPNKKNTEVDIIKPMEDIITIPFILTNDNLILASAEINGEIKNFIIDSGSPSIYLNNSYFRGDEKLSAANTGGNITNTDVREVEVFRIDSLNFHGIKLNNMLVPLSDLSHLENGVVVHGLIGQLLYKDYDILFDYKNKNLTLINPNYTSTYLTKNKCKFTEIPFTIDESVPHIPIIECKINDNSLSLALDCGAGANLIDKRYQEQFSDQMKNLKTVDLMGMNSEKSMKVYKGKLKNLFVGSKKFKNTYSVFSDIDHLTIQADGFIGYEILSRQKTILSYKNKKIIFVK